MESYEDDDDTHFCIKCHATVNGLDNYVRHRQAGCQSSEKQEEVGRDTPSTPATTSYPEILNADAFFSSLELQSSSKMNSRRNESLIERGKKLGRPRGRRKIRKSIEENEGKEKIHMLPVVTDLDDPTDHFGIPSLVGFPDIVSASGKAGTSGKSCAQQMHNTKMENSGFNNKSENMAGSSCLETLIGTEVKQGDRKRIEDSQRIDQDQVWLEDTILEDLVTQDNKDMTHSQFTEYDYRQDDDSVDDSVDDNLPEDDSYSDTDDDRQDYPPRGHTGGKWKPGLSSSPPRSMVQVTEEDEEAEDNPEHPPPSYTGGKWKPSDNSPSQKEDEEQVKEAGEQPPPGHTRGKWVPGARTDIGSGYWCSPCGRNLASRLVYNRHLLSDLHARRSIQEFDGNIRLPRRTGPLLRKKSTSRRQRILALKAKQASDSVENSDRKRLRKREKEILWCEMCHARVRRAQMGKHLLSHYHCRVAGANPCGSKERKFILDNMANIVRQCPFQCAACRFYCNTEETFLRHWKSTFHKDIHSKIRGSYQCTSCDFWCDASDDMETHFKSSAHCDVVSVMKDSVPVVIRRQIPLSCSSCTRHFRYNIQLRFHARDTGHESVTGSDEYQQRIQCNLCPQVLRSFISLQRHQLTSHSKDQDQELNEVSKPAPYFCSFCSLKFSSAQEAVQHRRTSRHKEIVRLHKSQGSASRRVRECPHCGRRHVSLSEHKEHLLRSHPELCHRCPRCGMLFALPQDVTRHTKDHSCSDEGRPDETELHFKCTSCTFGTNSRAEFLFHEALHAGSFEDEERNPEEGVKAPRKYRCPECKKSYSKVSLRNHIRSHTGERPFPCAKCLTSFSRRSALNAHQKDCLFASCTTSGSGYQDETGRRRNYICAECDNGFYTKHALRQHMLRHAGKRFKCGLPGCPTILRTAAELRSHRLLVHETSAQDRKYTCSVCPYAAKTSIQLRREWTKNNSIGMPLRQINVDVIYAWIQNFSKQFLSNLLRDT
ncbi:zinc finger protein 90 homolog isoform X2 [Cephus cinctus]|uniref:Zinc finger protein 90 homolog isoform X2 n=1 Tax=Cephus cinctus TaxID=211228 RepID=A0AAJ7C9K1_CEPCN|nr:zinc finger protein 90 homolog isoform X2 [Cephus cinctus]